MKTTDRERIKAILKNAPARVVKQLGKKTKTASEAGRPATKDKK